MIICKNCGTSNEAGATFCGSCGTFLEWSGETVEPTPPQHGTDGRPATPVPPPTAGDTAPTQPTPTSPIPVTPIPTPPTPTPGMVACPACGTDNEPTRVYCRRCATELRPGPPVAPVPSTPPAGRPKVPVALLAAGAGLLVVVVVAVMFLVPRLGPDADVTVAPDKPGTGAPSVAVPTASTGGETTAPSDAIEPPSRPEPTGRIAFSLDKGGNANIWIWDAASGKRTLLVGGGGDQSEPSWSPGGDMVVYRAAAGLTMVKDDGNPVEVPDFTHHGVDRNPAWSPDGALVAFASTRKASGGLDIYTRPVADNTQLARLTDDPADDWDPSWAPDGSRIVFVSQRNGPARLFLMNADGGRQREIDLGKGIFDDPAFSPDGEWIAFTRRDGKSDPKALYVARIDGSGRRRVTDVKPSESDPTWSPDGKLIAVVRGTDKPAIAIIDVVTGDKVATISVDGAGSRQPDWH